MDRGALNPTPRSQPTRADAIAWSIAHFENGDFRRDLARRLTLSTTSRAHGARMAAFRYLADEVTPFLSDVGFTAELIENDDAPDCPFLLATRIENPALPTVLLYAHGDVSAPGRQRRSGPIRLIVEGDRWCGSGIADSKAQHSITLAALSNVIEARRGQLGYNIKFLFEMGEEQGSPGLYELCKKRRDQLAADVMIACDGSRLTSSRPLIALGSLGYARFHLDLRPRGSWQNDSLPAMLTGIARSVSRPNRSAASDHAAPILALEAILRPGPNQPTRAIFHCRYADAAALASVSEQVALHLTKRGIAGFSITLAAEPDVRPARTAPNNPWVRVIAQSLQETLGVSPTILPQFPGITPSDIFSDILDLPTIWIPHAPPSCGRHKRHEHVLSPLLRDGLQAMSGVFWDIGDSEIAPARRRSEAPTLVLVSNR